MKKEITIRIDPVKVAASAFVLHSSLDKLNLTKKGKQAFKILIQELYCESIKAMKND